ncbi:MAG: hypothetical protein ACLSE6_01040 [Alphaproteobacteria bacterium]
MGLTVNNFWQSIKNLSPGRLASLAAIIIFLVSFLGYMVARMSSTEYAVLYTDLELEDAKQIISRLETDNVKYKLTKNGTEVMVPVDLVNKLRVDTAKLPWLPAEPMSVMRFLTTAMPSVQPILCRMLT